MVSTTHYSHQHQKDEHHCKSLRNAHQKPERCYAGDAQHDYYAGADAIRQPSCRQLANAIRKTECRDYQSRLSVIEGKFVADEW